MIRALGGHYVNQKCTDSPRGKSQNVFFWRFPDHDHSPNIFLRNFCFYDQFYLKSYILHNFKSTSSLHTIIISPHFVMTQGGNVLQILYLHFQIGLLESLLGRNDDLDQ